MDGYFELKNAIFYKVNVICGFNSNFKSPCGKKKKQYSLNDCKSIQLNLCSLNVRGTGSRQFLRNP